jgi:hypothetical protein
MPEGNVSTLSQPGIDALSAYAESHTNMVFDTDNLLSIYKDYVLHWSGGNYYYHFWTGVCLDSNVLVSALGPPRFGLQYGLSIKSSKMIESFFVYHQRVIAQETAANRSPWLFSFRRRLISFKDSPVEVLRRDKQLVYADLHCLVERAEPFPPIPVFVRLYWDKETREWLPMEFAEGVMQKSLHDKLSSTNIIFTVF